MNALLIDLENHPQHVSEEPNRVLLLCCKSLPPLPSPGPRVPHGLQEGPGRKA